MSQKQLVEIACPECKTEQSVTVWATVNAQGHPEARQEILDQRLNVFTCGQCGHCAPLDFSLLYHDMDKRFCVQYLNSEDMGSEEYYANVTKQGTLMFDGKLLPPGLPEASGHLFSPHFVFSMREMAAYIVFRDLCELWGR